MDLAGCHMALSSSRRIQPHPDILLSCQPETSSFSPARMIQPSWNPTVAHSLCKSKQSRPGGPGALRHPTHPSAHVGIAKEIAGSQGCSSSGSAGLL